MRRLAFLLSILISVGFAGNAVGDPGPLLLLDGGTQTSAGQPVILPAGFTSCGHNITALVFSIDLDTDRLSFDPTDSDLDGLPDSVSLPATPQIVFFDYDPDDEDGEIDILLSNLSGQPLPEGILLEIELVADRNGVLASWVAFSTDPLPSFGNDLGEDVEGSFEVLGAEIFRDGFESGDLGAWTTSNP